MSQTFARPRWKLATSKCVYRTYSSRTHVDDELSAAHQHCLRMLKTYNPPAYLHLSYLPAHTRTAFLALHAFDMETSRALDTHSSATVGSMRLQFWRDAASKSLAGTPPKEPVAVLLAAANDQLHSITGGGGGGGSMPRGIPPHWLHRMVDARAKYLGNEPYRTSGALETYAEHTASSLLYAVLAALPLASVTADHFASHVGKAAGIAGVLRALPGLTFPGGRREQLPRSRPGEQLGWGAVGGGFGKEGAVVLPVDVMIRCGVKEEEVLRLGPEAPNLRDAVFETATRANDHLITVKEMLAGVKRGEGVGHEFEHAEEEVRAYGDPLETGSAQLDEVKTAFPALLTAVTTKTWLQRLEAVNFDPFDRSLLKMDWKLPWRLYWAMKRTSL